MCMQHVYTCSWAHSQCFEEEVSLHVLHNNDRGISLYPTRYMRMCVVLQVECDVESERGFLGGGWEL